MADKGQQVIGHRAWTWWGRLLWEWGRLSWVVARCRAEARELRQAGIWGEGRGPRWKRAFCPATRPPPPGRSANVCEGTCVVKDFVRILCWQIPAWISGLWCFHSICALCFMDQCGWLSWALLWNGGSSCSPWPTSLGNVPAGRGGIVCPSRSSAWPV